MNLPEKSIGFTLACIKTFFVLLVGCLLFPVQAIAGSVSNPELKQFAGLFITEKPSLSRVEKSLDACGGSTLRPCGEQLAMHHGRPHGGMHERHQMHHGMGRGGKGICPQTRKTVQAPEEDYNRKNPLEVTEENIIGGENLFYYKAEPTVCKVCHGTNGNGLGMMAQGLNPLPRNFTCTATMKEIPDGQLFWIIRNGSPGTGMPAFPFLSDEDIWQLIIFIRTFAVE